MSTHLEYPPVAPYLAADDAAKAIDFYKTAFGAEERYRLIDKASGKIGHAELTIRGQLFMIADEYPGFNSSPKTRDGCTAQIVLMVDDTDTTYAAALAAGAVSVRPPQNEFYGHRTAKITDPAGHAWMIQHEIEKISPEEMQRRWDTMGSEGGEPPET